MPTNYLKKFFFEFKFSNLCILLLLLFLSSFKIIENKKTINNYSEEQVKKFVYEVFQEHSNELVYNKKSSRLKMYLDFLDRFSIENHPEFKGKKFDNLSEITLNNKYNKNLKRDFFMDATTFNPLKYNFEMFSKKKQIIQFNETDFFIIIAPTNNL